MTSSVHSDIADLLRYKQQLDSERETGLGYSGGEGQYTKRQRWLAEAVELLLRLALEQRGRQI
jgi:hypothetical protein